MRIHDTVRVIRLSDKEFFADKANRSRRRPDQPGVITGIIGRTNERYLVLHDGETVPAVYIREELEPEPNAYWRVTYQQQGRSCFSEVETYHDAKDLLALLEEDDARAMAIEGPFYAAKDLEDGVLPTRSLFDHLKSD